MLRVVERMWRLVVGNEPIVAMGAALPNHYGPGICCLAHDVINLLDHLIKFDSIMKINYKSISYLLLLG